VVHHGAARREVVVVGGGIAALETVLALHALAHEVVHVTVVAPDDAFALSSLSVSWLFERGAGRRLRWSEAMDEHAGRLVRTTVTKVDTTRRRVCCRDGTTVPYDVLVLAPGAVPTPVLPSSVTLDPGRPDTVAAVTQAVELGWSRAVALVVPSGRTWPLPLYEVALLIAARVRDRYGVALHLVSAERMPLAVFGAAASDAVARRLTAAGIMFHGGVATRLVAWQALDVGAALPLRVDHVVALPLLGGPGMAGVPADRDGFIPTDETGRVTEADGVWAVGDATGQPIEHGGIAGQQADAIAARIAAEAGAAVGEIPSDLVLRARLPTDSGDLYLQRPIGAQDGEASDVPLWSPPAAVAGHHLAAYLERKGLALDSSAGVR